jgi:hypothetical protein
MTGLVIMKTIRDLTGQLFMHLDLLHLRLRSGYGIIVGSLGCFQLMRLLEPLSGRLSSGWHRRRRGRWRLPGHFAFLLHFSAISNSED